MLILMLVGIFSLFIGINSNLCYDPKMNGPNYLNYYVFDQESHTYHDLYYENFFLLKPNRWGTFQRYSRGNIHDYIDFKRDFHFHLRDKSEFVNTWDSWFYCEENYGIAVVLGPYTWKDYKIKTGENLMITGLQNSIVIAFRASKNQIAIYNCKNKCDLNSPDKKYTYHFYYYYYYAINIDFHIVYIASEHKLKIYNNNFSAETNKILEYNIDLSTFGNLAGEGYLGITATDYNCGYYNHLLTSYICLNGGNPISPKVTLKYQNIEYNEGDSISAIQLQPFDVKIEYSSYEEKEMMGQGSLFINEEKAGCILSKSYKTYTFSCYLPKDVGKYTIKYKTIYESFYFYVDVQNLEIEQLIYESPEKKCCVVENKVRYLKFGTLKGSEGCGGDFDLSEFKDYNYLEFYVKGADKNGNPVKIREIIKIQDSLQSSSNTEILLSETETEFIYKVKAKVTKKGNYYINSTILDNSISFSVKNLVPSITYSKCNIEDYQPKAYNSDIDIKFICEFNDEDDKPIDIKEAIEERNVIFNNKIYRLADKIVSFEPTHKYYDGNKYTFVFKTNYNGKYKFETQVGVDKDMETVNSIQNTFYVSPTPTSLEGSYFYNFDIDKWIQFDNLKNTIFNYYEDNTDNDNLFLIDFVDLRNKEEINKYSDIQQPFVNFELKELNGEIEEKHSGFKASLTFEIFLYNEKYYILAKLKDSKTKMRRTTLEYIVHVEYKEYVDLRLNYVLYNHGDYVVCRKDLNISNSIIKTTKEDSIKAGSLTKVGELVLRTDLDHLYNYYLKDQSVITFTGECISKSNCEVEVSKNSQIEGVYDLKFKSNNQGVYTITFKISGEDLLVGSNSFTVNVVPNAEAYILEKVEEKETNYTVDEKSEFGFRIKDRFGNIINYDLPSDSFGLSYSIFINNKEEDNKNIKLVKGNDYYYIKESYTTSGDYKLILKTKYSQSQLNFEYYKSPGKAFYLNSKLNVINNNKLNLGDISIVELSLYDNYNNLINDDPVIYDRELEFVEIYATNEKGDRIDYYKFDSLTLKSNYIEKTGSFHVSANVHNIPISSCLSCNFDVIDSGFDFSLSQLKMVGDKIILMIERSYYTLYEGLQRPAFEFDFLTHQGLPSNEVDRNSDIKAKIDSTLLDKVWISSNKLLWILPEDYKLTKNNIYTIEIENNNNTKREYYLSVVEYGNDKSSDNKIEIAKTFVSPNILYLKPGKLDSFIVEFRGNDNLRYNSQLDITKFEYKNSSDFEVKAKLGSKNGQIIVDVLSYKACDFSQNCQISMSYDGETIDTKVQIVVNAEELAYFELDPSCIDKDSTNLLAGIAGTATKIKLYPKDSYGNLIKDTIFDAKIYSEESFSYLFNVKHNSEYKPTLETTINPASHYIELSITSTKVGKLTLSSKYLLLSYQMEIKSGEPSKYSTGHLEEKDGDTTSGTNRIFIIEPKDENGNKITNEDTIKKIINNYSIKIFDVDGNLIIDTINPNYNEKEGVIEYVIDNTKTGTKIVEAYYNNEEIIIGDNVINVVSGEPNLSKSKLIYNEKEYSLDETIKISLATLPTIDLQLYDDNENKITELSSDLEKNFALFVNDTELSNYITFNSYLRLLIEESKVAQYFKIDRTKNNNYLFIKIGDKSKKVDINFVEEAPEEVTTDEPASLVMSADNLVLKAGEKGLISLSFYTEKGKPMEKYFGISELIVSCPEDAKIQKQVLNGKYFGTYNLILSSESETNSQISCSVNVKNLSKEFKLRIIPNKVSKCHIAGDIPKAKAGEQYQLNFECSDKYGNKAYLEENQFSVKITNKNNEILEYNINPNNDYTFNLNFEPTIIGEYTIKSIYLENAIKFDTLPGEISPANTYVEINDEAAIHAGDDLNIDIHVLDKYNNEVVLDNSHKQLFDLYYRYIENSNYGEYKKVVNEPEIKDKNIIRYKHQVTKKSEFRGIYPKTSTIIKCSNCETVVYPSNLNISNSDIYKFNSFSQTFTKLEKYNDVLYNLDEGLFIRLHPKDSYGNYLLDSSLEITAKINDINLEKTDSNDEFIEFKDKNGEFSNLQEGKYELIIEYKDQKIIYNVDVSGKKGIEEDTLDISKTKLLEVNLDFTAGEYGYFNFELRNSNNARSNKEFEGTITILPTDDSVKYTIYNQKSSTILVLVTTNNSNTFPNSGESKLGVSINEDRVFDLELFVNPGDLSSAKINVKDDELEGISTDDELKFSLIGYDSLGNKALINANEAKLIVKCINEISYKLSFVDLSTGELKYIYELTLSGSYKISSGNNNKGENLFNNKTYSVNVTPGKICPEKTVVKLAENPIIAGKTASVIISVKDKKNNNVELNDDILKDFSGYILSDDYEIKKLDPIFISGSTFKYEKKLDKKGNYQFNIQYNNRKIKCNKLVVDPSVCKPQNTLIYSRDKNGQYIPFDKKMNIYSSYTSPLSLYLVFRDEFENIVEENDEIKIEDGYLYGNNMENLYWTYLKGKLDLDLNDIQKKNIINHLVTRIGEKSYKFIFTVVYKKENETFYLNVNHFGKREDEDEYGNGDYDLEFCKVEPMEAIFKAGTSFNLLLTLRTKESLIFNGDFDPNYIQCDKIYPEGADDTFKCKEINKKDTGIYIITIYTTKMKKEDEIVYNYIELFDSDHLNNKIFPVRLINTNGIPSKEKTVITKKLPEKITSDTEAIIEFILKDVYDNEFVDDKIISDLVFENNGIEIGASINYKNGAFWARLEPKYPPKNINIQLYYRDNDGNNIELFNEIQVSEFEFSVDYTKTAVNSKNIKGMKAGELLDLNIILYDQKMLCYDDEKFNTDLLYATVQGPLEKTTEIRTFNFKQYEDGSICKYVYKIDIDESTRYVETGTYSIGVYAGESKYHVASYTQTVISGDIDYDNFVIYYTEMDDKSYTDENIPAGETIHFTVQAYDHFNNKIDHDPLSSDIFHIKVTPEYKENNLNSFNGGSGSLNYQFNTTKVGRYNFEYYYNGTKIDPNTKDGPDSILYIPGACSPENPGTEYPNPKDVEISSTYTYYIHCLDKYNNSLNEGGAKFTSEVTLFINDSKTTQEIVPKIKDNEDGSYEVYFIPPLAGEYSIFTYLDGKKYEEQVFNLEGKTCDKPYVCPNGTCVDDLRDCIPNDRKCLDPSQSQEKPFKCKDGRCVKSQTECETEGALKCPYMNVSYPPDKEYLCSYYLPLDCKRKYPSYRILCKDGICRKSKSLQPNQRVCPIGKILCADLTCADSIDECYNGWPECGVTQIRCPDQSCVDDQKNCPTSITCPNVDDYVCPDGTCVENEIYCTKLKTCPDETPYLCSDYSCAKNPESCTHTVACGHGKSLCIDLICRETC